MFSHLLKISDSSLVPVVVVYVCLFLVYFPFAIILTPYGDTLDWLSSFYSSNGNFLEYLWSPHNGHRLVFSKLLTIADAELLGGLSYPVAIVNLLLLTGIAALTLNTISIQVKIPEMRRWALVIALFLLFSTTNFPNYAYPVDSQYVICVFFVVSACVSWVHACGDTHAVKNRYIALAIVFGLAASVSSLNGVLVWPLLIWIAWVLEMNKKYLVFILVLGVMFLGGFTYFADKPQELPSSFTLSDAGKMLNYLIEYHGMPWVDIRRLYWPAKGLGAVVLAMTIIQVFQSLRKGRKLTPVEAAASAMLFFALGSAVMITLGRYNLGLLPAHRYGIFVVITYVSLLLLKLPSIEGWMAFTQRRDILIGTTFIVGVILVIQQIAAGQFSVKRSNAFAQFEKHILAGGQDEEATTAIYFANAKGIREHYSLLKAHNIYMFKK